MRGVSCIGIVFGPGLIAAPFRHAA